MIEVQAQRKEIGMPQRPGELIYALDETPPWPHLLALGFQHIAVICPYLVMVALVAEAAKLPHARAKAARAPWRTASGLAASRRSTIISSKRRSSALKPVKRRRARLRARTT
jgi:hypothetical protein